MPNHLEPARNNWDAVLTVPKELRGKYDLPKPRFRKSTGTTDKRMACKIASQYVAGWQIQIEQAKGADTSALSDAMQFRTDIENARDAEHRRELEEVLITHVEGIENAQGLEKAKEFYAVAQSKQTPSSTYFTQWKTYAEANLKAKTADQWGRDIQEFINQFPTLDTVSTRTVRL